jgi:hypothetical protein
MAYFIFLKYLDSLEDFRKNPHVKIPPKSPCANFQSLGIFKNQIFIQKGIFPSLSAQSVQRPASPSGLSAQPCPHLFSFFPNRPPPSPHRALASRPTQPALTAQPTVFFLLPHRSKARKPPPPGGLTPPPWSAPNDLHRRKIMAASLLLHFPH